MGIKHVFWVVGSKFIYAAELNELLINAERQEQYKSHVSECVSFILVCALADLGVLLSWAAYLGFLNSFFFWMWLFVSKSPWSFLSYNLWILSCYKINKSVKSQKKHLSFQSAFSTHRIWSDKETESIHNELSWTKPLFKKSLMSLRNIWQPGITGSERAGRHSRAFPVIKSGEHGPRRRKKMQTKKALLAFLEKWDNTVIIWSESPLTALHHNYLTITDY